MEETIRKRRYMKKDTRKKKFYIPPISHYPSRKEWEYAVWKLAVRFPEILGAVITPSERRNLVMRVAVRERILSGKSYREIGNEVWCSPQTVSGMKKALHEEQYRSYWERGKTERKKKAYSPMFRGGLREKSRKKARATHTGLVQLSGIPRSR